MLGTGARAHSPAPRRLALSTMFAENETAYRALCAGPLRRPGLARDRTLGGRQPAAKTRPPRCDPASVPGDRTPRSTCGVPVRPQVRVPEDDPASPKSKP